MDCPMKTVLMLLLSVYVAAQVNPYADCCDSYCYREDENPYLNFATKTAYEFVFGKASNQHLVPHCRAVQFWSFNRHGSRLPTTKSIMLMEQIQRIKDEIIKNYDSRGSYPESGKLCEKDLEGFRRWNWNNSISTGNAEALTDQGKDDIRYLARRYQTRYPELMRGPYSDQRFTFRFTETQRTRASFEAFAEGLFGSEAFKVHASSSPSDNLTSAYASCEAWQDRINKKENLKEQMLFKQRAEYQRLIAHVSRRLGFRYTLNETVINTMYDVCRYEKSWYVNRNSPWCAAFTKEHLRLLEYSQDLFYFYTNGYGYENNHKLGCSTMKDMMDRFGRIVNGDQSEPKAVVYFSHSAALQLLLVSLGINKDSLPLTADNMMATSRRMWRTSTMTPFSGNLAIVLYECNQNERFRVMFFLNEKPVDYPGCSVGLCSWQYLKEQLSESMQECNLDFCNESGASSVPLASPLVLAFVLFTSIISV